MSLWQRGNHQFRAIDKAPRRRHGCLDAAEHPARPGRWVDARTAMIHVIGVGSEEARSIALALASVRRSNWACSFPAPSFHEDAALRAALEGVIEAKLTSPYSL